MRQHCAPQTPGATGTATVAAPQPTTYQNPMAYVGPDGNVYITNPGGGAGIAITNDANGKQIQTTPFVSYDHSLRAVPLVARWDETAVYRQPEEYAVSGDLRSATVQVASGLAALYPGVWSPDGSEFAYAVETNQASGDNGLVRQLQALPVTATGVGSARVAGSFVQGVGCGGGSPDPADHIYKMEAGYDGNGLTLAWMPQGVVYSTTCNGIGLALANTTGQVLWNVGNLSRAAISPDRTRAVAIQGGNGQQTTVALLDLATGNVTADSVYRAERRSTGLDERRQSHYIQYTVRRPDHHCHKLRHGNASLFRDWAAARAQLHALTCGRRPVSGGSSVRCSNWMGAASA